MNFQLLLALLFLALAGAFQVIGVEWQFMAFLSIFNLMLWGFSR